MSKRLTLNGQPLCVRHSYFGVAVLATLCREDDPAFVPMYCEECHRFLYPNLYTTRGGVEQPDPQNQPTIGKEA